MSLSFDEDLGRTEMSSANNKAKNKKNKKGKKFEEPSQLQENDKKKSRKELMSKTRNEVLTHPWMFLTFVDVEYSVVFNPLLTSVA